MARDFQINGETLVLVKGNPGSGLASLTELGLTSGTIDIHPVFFHEAALTDDFGPNVPADWLFYLAWFEITMQLVHYDDTALENCLLAAMAGPASTGVFVGAGTSMGGGKALLADGNNYISLNLSSPVGQNPWHFPSAYILGSPAKIPLGTERSLVDLTWRAVPYVTPTSLSVSQVAGDWISAGAKLYDHTLDT